MTLQITKRLVCNACKREQEGARLDDGWIELSWDEIDFDLGYSQYGYTYKRLTFHACSRDCFNVLGDWRFPKSTHSQSQDGSEDVTPATYRPHRARARGRGNA